jgi:hypothetical protein
MVKGDFIFLKKKRASYYMRHNNVTLKIFYSFLITL